MLGGIKLGNDNLGALGFELGSELLVVGSQLLAVAALSDEEKKVRSKNTQGA